jgi:hypothetical protein
MKDKINWNISEDYGRYLVDVIKRIDLWFIQGNFELIYKEVSNIYSQMAFSIENRINKGKERCKEIEEHLLLLNNVIIEYKTNEVKMKTEMQRIRRIRLLGRCNQEAGSLYKLIMATIDELGLLFNTTKIDDRLSAYKQ